MLTNEQLRDRIADAILAVTYPAEDWPDGPPGEGEMDTAHTEADAVMAVVEPEMKQLRHDLENMTASRDLWRSDVKDAEAAQAAAEADRDRAREIAVALEQQLAEIKRLAYMGGQNGEVVRGWIIGVLERGNATSAAVDRQDAHVCSPQTCGGVYDYETEGL